MLEDLLDGPLGAVLLLEGARVDVFEQLEQHLERVVVVAATVVDEVERDLADVIVDLVHRHDARRVHDRRVEPGFSTLVEVDAVEHVAQRGLQSEAHVRETEHRRCAGKLGLDATDRLDGGHAVAAEVFGTGAERERQRVEDQIGRIHAVPLDGGVVDPLAHP